MKLTVVVAVWQDAAGLADCLDALQPQVDADTEVLLVATFAAPPELPGSRPWLRWIAEPPQRLIPHLWARGIREAGGEIVVVTTAHFAPAPDWLQRVRDAHRRLDAVGIGGAFDPPRGGGAGDWATYFLRYGKYLRHRRQERVSDIAADNASYRRDALQAHRGLMQDGFWEPDFHRAVLAEGATLAFDPSIRVVQRASFGIGRFCRQRLHHGRQFGRARMAGRGRPARVLFALALPLIPPVLLAKVFLPVWASRRDLGAFLACLPVLLLFVSAWALGEVQGYLGAPPAAGEGA